MIMDDKGHKDKILPSIQPVIGKAGAYLVEYTPTNHGLHSVNVSFAGCFIPSSPFGVNVGLGEYFWTGFHGHSMACEGYVFCHGLDSIVIQWHVKAMYFAIDWIPWSFNGM